jgi:extradiol dioxygenase family protein
MEPLPPFHLAFPVTDLETTRRFYTEILGCSVGRRDERWVDFNLYGHQITAHLVEKAVGGTATSTVDNKQVPVRHFGVILTMDAWRALADKVRNAGVEFIIEPGVRFKGEAGEQATLFFRDPCGNALEFKAFADPARIFASDG